MKLWTDLFRRPARLTDSAVAAWFGRIADHLLNRTHLAVAGAAHRPIEIEFYYRHPRHFDPFAHGDPVQIHAGRWYFHKTGGAFRGGTYKGVDLTFGDGEAHGGILIRSIATLQGSIIDGPSLVVDHLLWLTGRSTVAELDQAIGERLAWDSSSPLHFIESPNLAKPILSCARVGLSLRRARSGSTMPGYLTRPYRYLTEPAGIAKGKVQMVLALHKAGRVADEIRRATGCPSSAITEYIAEYEDGLRQGQFEDYFGKDLGAKDLCRLHGIADRS